jgi:hypothetical protein
MKNLSTNKIDTFLIYTNPKFKGSNQHEHRKKIE